jgi:hypothetical protein
MPHNCCFHAVLGAPASRRLPDVYGNFLKKHAVLPSYSPSSDFEPPGRRRSQDKNYAALGVSPAEPNE